MQLQNHLENEKPILAHDENLTKIKQKKINIHIYDDCSC